MISMWKKLLYPFLLQSYNLPFVLNSLRLSSKLWEACKLHEELLAWKSHGWKIYFYFLITIDESNYIYIYIP